MRQVQPSGEFPDNVRPARFDPPEEMQEDANPAYGLMHLHPETNEAVALEFMFELTEDEIHVLKHEPYVTLTIMTDHLHPFALQTSYPPDPKYRQVNEHNHICASNKAHEGSQWWKCDNPSHDPIKDRERECDSCWRMRTGQATENDDGEGEDGPVV